MFIVVYIILKGPLVFNELTKKKKKNPNYYPVTNPPS